jgi:hypothetical protein
LIRVHVSHDKNVELRNTLTGTYMMRLLIRIRNEDEKAVTAYNAPADRVISGEVQYDVHGDTTRSLTLTIVDPEGKLRMEHGSPAKGAIYVNRFVSVEYQVWLPHSAEWVGVPVFWGPITGFSRDGAEVTIEGMGKELLLQDPHFLGTTLSLKKGTTIHDAIVRIARHMGERRFHIPQFTGQRLKRTVSVSRWTEAWDAITGGEKVHGLTAREPEKGHKHHKKHGKGKHEKPNVGPVGGLIRRLSGHHWRAFYDGLGRLCVRELKKHPVYRFKWGRDFVTRPSITYDNINFRNEVVVIGGQAKKKKHRVVAKARLKHTDPLSPQRLAWNGVPRNYTHKIRSEDLKTFAEANEKAEQVLKQVSQQAVDVEFTCMPIPMLEEGDWCELITDEYRYLFQLKSWTLPLDGSPMTIGRKKRVRPRKRKHKTAGGAGPGGRGGSGGKPGRHHKPHHKPGHKPGHKHHKPHHKPHHREHHHHHHHKKR